MLPAARRPGAGVRRGDQGRPESRRFPARVTATRERISLETLLIRCRSFYAVEHENFNGALNGLERQTKLLAKGSGK